MAENAAIAAAMEIAGLKKAERIAWNAHEKTQRTWKTADAAMWTAILRAMRDCGATIQVAHDAEEGMCDATLYLGDKGSIGVAPSDVSEYGDWMQYAEDGGGFGTFVWCEKTAELLADFEAEANG